jgi:hypothetical protein
LGKKRQEPNDGFQNPERLPKFHFGRSMADTLRSLVP